MKTACIKRRDSIPNMISEGNELYPLAPITTVNTIYPYTPSFTQGFLNINPMTPIANPKSLSKPKIDDVKIVHE